MYKALNPFPCLLAQANSATINKSYQMIVIESQLQSGKRKTENDSSIKKIYEKVYCHTS